MVNVERLCFDCPLRECDDTSPDCPLRQLTRRFEAKAKKRRAEIQPDERAARQSLFRFYRLERHAQASEGLRPYNCVGSPWRTASDPRPGAEAA